MKMKSKQYKPMIVVTGGAGFIGSGVIRYLNDRGEDQILVVDEWDKTEKWKNLVGKKFVDAIDKNDLFSWVEGRQDEISAFIHLGACTSTVETDIAYLLETNYRYTLRMAEDALKQVQGFSDDHSLLEQFHPLNMYGYSKHLFDLWASRQGVLNQMTGLKFFNVFGPNENHKGRMASAITHILPTAQREGVIRLFKSSDPHNFSDGG